jgi:hypothetical protein
MEGSSVDKVERRLEIFTTVSFVVISKPLPFSSLKIIIMSPIDRSVQVSTAVSANIPYKLVYSI